ncbi:inositol-3-phosphate synthase [Streptomyces sp. URMC 125]|uniref:inositol-3-phosphate synthase n=1 Tax=Streptomyces sp. URMC 125 TaxID=3423419 RepID=UPI003F19322E
MTAWGAYGGRGAVGVWLVGARGSVGVTTIAGTAALCAGLVPPTGCVTARREFSSLELPRFDELVFGGHDIAPTGLLERAERLADEGVMPPGLPRLVRDGLLAAEEEVRPGVAGTGPGPGGRSGRPPGQEEAIRRLTDDILSFRRRLALERVVVVNVAPPGPAVPSRPAHASLSALRQALAAGERVLPDGALYACAALRADCSYVDLAPPPGGGLPVLAELAVERGLPYAGGEGGSGGALLRSALDPVLAHRALDVRSWSGDRVRGGRRTAREQVCFEGFLGARMALRFSLQGCESALTAPLVLDLARLMALADRAGVRGPVPELSFFFGGPAPDAPDGREGPLEERYAALVDWAHGLSVPV